MVLMLMEPSLQTKPMDQLHWLTPQLQTAMEVLAEGNAAGPIASHLCGRLPDTSIAKSTRRSTLTRRAKGIGEMIQITKMTEQRPPTKTAITLQHCLLLMTATLRWMT